MPALPPVPNVLRLDWLWSDGTSTNISSRSYWRYSGGPPTGADCTTLAHAAFTGATVDTTLWDTSTILRGMKVTDLSSLTGGVGQYLSPSPGLDSGAKLTAGAAALVNYQIGRRYRGGKPRTYFPFGSSTHLSTRQTWLPAFVTQINSVLTTFYNGFTGQVAGATTITAHVSVSYYAGFTSVQNPVTHRYRNVNTVRVTPVVDTITSFSAAAIVASQRRRNRGS